MEWDFVQRETQELVEDFTPAEKYLPKVFIPALLDRAEAKILELAATNLPVKQAGL